MPAILEFFAGGGYSDSPVEDLPVGAEGEIARVLLAKDLYEVLGVSKDFDQEDLRKAKRKLSLATHPDKHRNAPGANQAFARVTEVGFVSDKIELFPSLETWWLCNSKLKEYRLIVMAVIRIWLFERILVQDLVPLAKIKMLSIIWSHHFQEHFKGLDVKAVQYVLFFVLHAFSQNAKWEDRVGKKRKDQIWFKLLLWCMKSLIAKESICGNILIVRELSLAAFHTLLD